jgi:hypothetical protein
MNERWRTQYTSISPMTTDEDDSNILLTELGFFGILFFFPSMTYAKYKS